VFTGGVVSYDNGVKAEVLKVPAKTLDDHGAVSAETVRSMASHVREMIGTTYGLAISGVAGPGGGTAEKPVGTVWLAVSGPDGKTKEMKILYVNDRRSVRVYSAYVLLDLLRRELLGLGMPAGYPVMGK
jgi:nicotinamide-nucleotide amidase